MKKILFLIALISLSACKTWDLSMMSVPQTNNQQKLLALQKRYGDFDNIYRQVPDDESGLFTQELETNLMDPYGDHYGYISLITRVVDHKQGWPFVLITSATLGASTLIGMPVSIEKYKLAVEVRIHDSQSRLLGKYAAIGESAYIPVAAFYGYREVSANRKAYVDALASAMDSIRPQIQKDIPRVNALLRGAGILEVTPID